MESRDSGDGGWHVLPRALRRRVVWKSLTVVALAMVVSAAIGVVVIGEASATLDGQVRDRMTTTAELQADALNRWLDGHRDEAMQLAERRAVARGDAEAMQTYLDSQRAQFGADVAGVHYVADNGTVLASTDRTMVGQSVGGPAGTAIEEGLPAGQATVVRDVYRRSGARVAGIYAVAVGGSGAVLLEATLGEPVAGFDAEGQRGYTTLHDGGGIAYSTIDDPAGVPGSALGSSSVGTVRTDGEVLGHAPIIGTDWVIVRHLPTSAAFAVRDAVETGLIAVVVAPLVLLGGVAALGGWRRSRALERLASEAERIEDGDLDTPLEADRIDEIGRLTRALDSMRESLKAEIESARQAREEAESAREEAVETNRQLERAAQAHSEVMADCAAGDLTVRMDPDGSHEAMDRIAADCNEMLDELERTVGQLKDFADDVADTSEHVEGSTASLRQASAEVAEAIQQVSIDAYEQQEQLATVSEEMDALAEALERYDDSHPDLDMTAPLGRVREASRLVAEVADLAGETTEAAETVAGAAEEQTAELNEVSQQADTLRQYAVPLGRVLGRFKTDASREFYFPSGPGNRAADDSGPGD